MRTRESEEMYLETILLLKGKKAAPYVRLIVAPATNKVYKEAIKAGYIRTFVEAGAVIIHPCCGLCCGMPYGLLADDEVILSTANRNFIGRMGTKKTLKRPCRTNPKPPCRIRRTLLLRRT